MSVASLPLLDSLSALSDSTRCRMLWLLDQQELTVSELCSVLTLPQSTVSRHLKTLADAGWLQSRRDGTSRYYRLALDGGAQAELWRLMQAQLADRTGAADDARELARVLAARTQTSRQFFESTAGEWDHLREELFGKDFSTHALLALLPSDWVVADLGCGTGAVLPTLAESVGRVIGVDASEEMLTAARARITGLQNVELRRGSVESLPLESASVDAALMVLVLHHLPAPGAAVAEAARVLKPGGVLLVVDMLPHDREELRRDMGHVWLGFSEEQLRRFVEPAGLRVTRVAPLPAVARSKGPSLFAAVARKETLQS